MPLFKVHVEITMRGDAYVEVEANDAAEAGQLVKWGQADVDWDEWLDLADADYDVKDDPAEIGQQEVA